MVGYLVDNAVALYGIERGIDLNVEVDEDLALPPPGADSVTAHDPIDLKDNATDLFRLEGRGVSQNQDVLLDDSPTNPRNVERYRSRDDGIHS